MFEVDHAYLRQTVAAPLTEAMAQLAVAQPEDPIEYLGNYLLKYVANETEKQRAKSQAAQRPPTSRKNETSSTGDSAPNEQALLVAKEHSLQVQLAGEKDVATLLRCYAESLASMLGAEEAYIGRKCVDAGGVPVVHFVTSSRVGSSTVDKVVTEDKGVTFDAFKEVEADPAAVDAEGNPLPPSLPKYIHVENVLREPRMKFFGVPKLGAYLTRAVPYKSFLHADVFNEGNPDEPNALEQWLVVSADKMGQARSFTDVQLDSFHRTTTMFAATLEQLEQDLYTKDRERQSSTEDANLRDFHAAFTAQVTGREENLAQHLQEVGEDEKLIKEAELRLAYLTELMTSFVPTLAMAALRVVPFKSPALAAFGAAFELLGYERAVLFNPVTKTPSWDRLAPLLLEVNLSASLANFQVAAPPPVTTVKLTLGETSKADVEAASVIALSFFQWTQAAIAFREQLDAAEERERQRAFEAQGGEDA